MTFERLQAEVYSILRRLRVMEYQKKNIVELSNRDSPYTIDESTSTNVYLVDTTLGDVLIILPEASTVVGREWTFKKLVAANDVHARISAHKSMLRKGKHHSKILQRGYNKYGQFKWEILFTCPVEYLIKLEDWCLQSTEINSGANINKSASNPVYRKLVTQRPSKKGQNKGRKNPCSQKWFDTYHRNIEHNKTVKLKPYDVVNLINDFNLGATVESLSKKYNTCVSNIWLILNGRSRKKYFYLVNQQRLEESREQIKQQRMETFKEEYRNRALLIIEEYNNYVREKGTAYGYAVEIDRKYNFPIGTASYVISGRCFPEYQNLIFRDTPKNEPIKLVRNSKNESPIKLEYKKVVYEFNSLRECGRQLGISTGNLSRLISGKMNYYKGIKILQ